MWSRSLRARAGGRLQIAAEPVEDAVVHVERIRARVPRQAVIAIRIRHEFRSLAKAPQRVEHHLALAEENRQVLLAVQDQHWRLHLVEVKERGLREVTLGILERGAAHPR